VKLAKDHGHQKTFISCPACRLTFVSQRQKSTMFKRLENKAGQELGSKEGGEKAR
jgi:hypothetical protein